MEPAQKNLFENKIVDAQDVKFEDGVEELLNSPPMKPYGKYILARVTGADPTAAARTIAELPLQERYVWRIASALKWGFADFEDWSVDIDRQTMPPADLAKVLKLNRHRPSQFCLMLRVLLGTEAMERTMLHAIEAAKQA